VDACASLSHLDAKLNPHARHDGQQKLGLSFAELFSDFKISMISRTWISRFWIKSCWIL